MTTSAAQDRLTHLLAMEQDEIDADFAKYQGRVAVLIERIRMLLHRPRAERTAAVEAKIAHLRMIQAHEFSEDATLPPEVRTFYVALAVEKIAQDAGMAAFEKGTLADLSQQMEEFRQKEGRGEAESWQAGEEPHHYRQLADQQKEMVERIEQTVVVFFLRRYRLPEYADLYENDRATFEVQREVGRILMMEGGSLPEQGDMLSSYIGKRYGREAVQRILSRLREFRDGADNGVAPGRS